MKNVWPTEEANVRSKPPANQRLLAVRNRPNVRYRSRIATREINKDERCQQKRYNIELLGVISVRTIVAHIFLIVVTLLKRRGNRKKATIVGVGICIVSNDEIRTFTLEQGNTDLAACWEL